MNAALPLVAGLSTVFAVAAIVASLFAVWRGRAMVDAAETRLSAAHQRAEAAIRIVSEELGGLAAQVRDLPQQALAGAIPSPARSGLNLSKRSQVLRMHRRGDPPYQIATALEVPIQEVDLLIKVQRIVLSNV